MSRRPFRIVIRRAERSQMDAVLSMHRRLRLQLALRRRRAGIRSRKPKPNSTGFPHVAKAHNLVLVARTDHQSIGYCWCVIVDYGLAREGTIEELYVEKRWRGRGVGKDLLQEMLKICRKKTVEVVFVVADASDARALSLYRDAGFTETTQKWLFWSPKHRASSS